MKQDTTKIPLEALEGLDGLLPEPNTADVTTEVLDESIGDQIEVLRLPWHTLIYDARNDLIELAGVMPACQCYSVIRSGGR